jgi:two-component system, cell cycle response regulator DivK
VSDELILIVEDNEKNLRLLRDILQFEGFRTLDAMTGRDGIWLAQQNTPALILMDIQLPDMNGMEALKALRQDERTRSIPVLAVSASVMPEQRKVIAEAGFDGFQEKPIEIEQFVEKVAATLRQHRKGA